MGNIYVGNNSSLASKIKKCYLGVGGTARKIKKVYAGDSNNIARLVWSAVKEKYLFYGYEYFNNGSSSSVYRNAFSLREGSPNSSNYYTINTDNYNAGTYQTLGTNTVISKNDASIAVVSSNNTLYFIKKINGIYENWFNVSISEYFGDSSCYYSTSSILKYDLSPDGTIFYCVVHKKYQQDQSDITYSYLTKLLFYDISNGSLVLKNSILLDNQICSRSSTYYPLSFYLSASDDFNVISCVGSLRYYDDSNDYYTRINSVFIENFDNDYTVVSLLNNQTGYNVYSQEKVCVSPNGNYITYMVADSDEDYNRKYVCAKVNKTSKTISLLSEYFIYIHSSDYYIMTQGWIDEEHFFYVINYTTVQLRIYSVINDTIMLLSDITMIDSSGNTMEGTIEYNDTISYSSVTAMAFDLSNNKMIFSSGNGYYYLCTLTEGTNGTYTGYTYDATYSVGYASTCISNIVWQTS